MYLCACVGQAAYYHPLTSEGLYIIFLLLSFAFYVWILLIFSFSVMGIHRGAIYELE